MPKGIYLRSDEVNQKISAALMGHGVSEKTRRKLSDAHSGKKLSEEHKRKIGDATKNRAEIYRTEEFRNKISLIHKGRKRSDKTRRKISEVNMGKVLPEWVCKRISEGKKGVLHSEEHKRKISIAHKGKPKSEEHRIKIAELNRMKWQSKDFQSKMKEAFKLRPNKPEKLLQKLLDEVLPSEYKYVGNWEFWLGGKNPDFMHISGKKKLIEMFGDYWHKKEECEVRKNHFKKYGFDTLIVWEVELKDPEILIKKLLKFNKE